MIFENIALPIKTNLDGGRILQIGQGNFFEVDRFDRMNSRLWSVGSAINLKRQFGFKFILEHHKFGKIEKVSATLLT